MFYAYSLAIYVITLLVFNFNIKTDKNKNVIYSRTSVAQHLWNHEKYIQDRVSSS